MYDEVTEVTLELRPGVGGAESSIFVEDISNMFIGYCQNQGWRTTVTSAIKESTGEGYKKYVLKVTGEDVYKIMKC
jgi:peptide chain release factor 1